ncbi:MAG TPA: LysE family transporter [Burkholderiaceae bacterium]|nr:LysE family transporter [Burkholderiaceae bacterium]
MSWEQWLGFFVAAWIISLSPGAGAVASMATGQRVGFRRGYWNIVGLQLALVLQMLIVAAGLGAVLVASDFAFQAIKWFGVAYLLYLGWKQWSAGGSAALVADAARTEVKPARLVLRGFLVNMSNPKAIVFLLAVLPQFLDLSRPVAIQYAWMTITMVSVDMVVMMGYTGLAARVLSALRSARQQTVLNRTFGGLFMAAAAVLAFTHRSDHL